MKWTHTHIGTSITMAGLALMWLSVRAEVASFTDSQGRTLVYQYALKPEWNPEVPRGVVIRFHGNNEGAQQQMLDNSFPSTQRQAYAQDLVPVVVASPEAIPVGRDAQLQRYQAARYAGYGIRVWREEDESLIQELLQSHFGGRFRVDFDHVVFWGGSAGTCLLNLFLPRFGDDYGGGLLADCGCWPARDPVWQPPRSFRDRFRVFVRAATDDFLHTESIEAYGYYKHIVGLEARGDFERPGGHCSAGNVTDGDAIAWLLRGTGLSEVPDERHFNRLAVMDGIAALTVDTGGTLWVARQPTPALPASIWRSVDRGRTLEPVAQTALVVRDLDAVGGALILTSDRAILRSTDGGAEFGIVDIQQGDEESGVTTTDRQGRIYVLVVNIDPWRPEVYRSDDLGESWTSLGPAGTGWAELIPDPISTEGQEGYLFLRNGAHNVEWIGSTSGNDWRPVEATPGGPLRSATWDGGMLWGLGGHQSVRLYSSVDHGRTWASEPMPTAATNTSFSEVTALGDRELLIVGDANDGFLFDRRNEWRHVLGGAAIGGPGTTIGTTIGSPVRRIAVDQTRGDVFVSDGRGLFRLDAGIRELDDLGTPADADGDGIADGLDAFPDDPVEFLDTDGDAVGNAMDADDDGDGVEDEHDDVPLDASETTDTDGDGVGDLQDQTMTATASGTPSDAFPLDRREQTDSDGDGVGDWADEDNDGDGVPDVQDAFPLHPREWSDADGDGIGDNIDVDDDNDGVPDEEDAVLDPGGGAAVMVPADPAELARDGIPWRIRRFAAGTERPDGYRYPPVAGRKQQFGHLALGDGPDPQIQFMIDHVRGTDRRSGREDVRLVYFDRNDNGDLSDDGPPAKQRYRDDWLFLEVRYASGIVVPYAVQIGDLEWGRVRFGGAWIGEVETDLSRVAVLAIDHDIDGMFDGADDYVCVDINDDRELACQRNQVAELFRPGDLLQMDGRTFEVAVAAPGHQVDFRSVWHFAPQAALLPIGPPLPGTIDDASDVDIFRIDLQGSATLEVRTSGPTDVRGELLDGTGTWLASDDDSGPAGHNFLVRADLEAGIYYVAVTGEPGDYAVMARLGDAPDHGEAEATATLLTLYAEADLGRVSPSALLAAPGRIAPTTADVDVFRLDVPLDATDVAIRSAGGTDVFARLLDSSLDEIASDASDGNFRIEARLDAGIHYVEVGGRETGTYRVLAWGDSASCPCAATAASDHGGTAESATLMPIGAPLPGTIDDASDVDMFRIDLQGSATLEVRTSGPTDVRGELLDDTGARLLSDDDSGPAGHNFLVRADLEAGIYYVAVRGEPGDYAVMARLGDAPDHGETAATATLLTLYAEADWPGYRRARCWRRPGRSRRRTPTWTCSGSTFRRTPWTSPSGAPGARTCSRACSTRR